MTAAEKALGKALVGSGLDSAGWARVHAGLRDRAFFSAKVEEARVLRAMREQAAQVAAGRVSASEFRHAVREALGAERLVPGAAGADAPLVPGAGDENAPSTKHSAPSTKHSAPSAKHSALSTKHRLDLIRETNVRQARGYVQHVTATTPGALAAEPCQELVRVRSRKNPRDWTRRWTEAGGRLYGGRMIARKDDPVWVRISRFGVPWPPFDFGSGMGVDGVARSEAVRLGVVRADDPPPRMKEEGMNDALRAEVPLPDGSAEARWLKEVFGDQVRFDGNVAHWQGELIRDVVAGRVRRAKLGRGFDGRNLSLSHNIIAQHIRKHVGENDRDRRNVPLTVGDFELIPAMWRRPDRVAKEDSRDHLAFETFDGILHLIVDPVKGIVTFYKQKSPKGA